MIPKHEMEVFNLYMYGKFPIQQYGNIPTLVWNVFHA